jgi:hypothetical protein
MRTNVLFGSLVLALVAAVGVHPGAQTPAVSSTERKLELKFDGNGYATLIAQNVSVSEVFAEWARVGKTRIANAEKLPNSPITVQFDNIEERKLVDALVRQSKAQGAGWIAAAREVDAPSAPSRLEVISISPRSSPSNTYVATSPTAPLYPQGTIDDNTEMPPVMPPVGPGPAQQQQQPVTRPPTSTGPGVPLVPVGPGAPTPLPGGTNTTGRGRGGF